MRQQGTRPPAEIAVKRDTKTLRFQQAGDGGGLFMPDLDDAGAAGRYQAPQFGASLR